MGTEIDPTLLPPSFPADGIIGFGLTGGSIGSDPTSFFEDLVNQGNLNDAQAVFGLAFDDSTPELVMGGTDFTRFSGSLTVVPIDSPVSISRGVPHLRLTLAENRQTGRSR